MGRTRAGLWAATVIAGLIGFYHRPAFFIAGVSAIAAKFAREEEIKVEQYHKDFVKPLHAYRKKAVRAVGEEAIAAQASLETLKIQAEFHKRAGQTIGLNPAVHSRLRSDLQQKFGLISVKPERQQQAAPATTKPAQQFADIEYIIEDAPPSIASQVQAASVLPLHDLWEELESSNRHVWLVATTQSGKTWAEYAILTHAFDRSDGKAQAIISDIKGSAFQAECGIADYYFSDQVDDMPIHKKQIDKALKLLSMRRHARVKNGGTWGSIKPAPLFLVIPELNSYVNKVKEWDVLNPPPKANSDEPPRLKLAQEVGLGLLEIITQGLEDNVRLIVDAQTSRIEEFNFGTNVKFTGGTRNNLSMAGISRQGDYIGIRDFFKFNCDGMPGSHTEDLLKYDREQTDKKIPIAATNMGGRVRLVQTPAIELDKIKRDWKPIELKAQPKRESAKTGAEAIQEIVTQILQVVGQNPTDEDLINAYDRVCTPNWAPSDPESRQRLIEYLRDTLNGKI